MLRESVRFDENENPQLVIESKAAPLEGTSEGWNEVKFDFAAKQFTAKYAYKPGVFGISLRGNSGAVGEDYSELSTFPLIGSIENGSPAEKVGLREGDIVLEVDGHSVKGASISELSNSLYQLPDRATRLRVFRPKPYAYAPVRVQAANADYGVIGIGWKNFEAGKMLQITSVVEGGPAQEVGIRTGDYISRINDKRIADLDSETEFLIEYRKGEGIKVFLVGYHVYDFVVTRTVGKLETAEVSTSLPQMKLASKDALSNYAPARVAPAISPAPPPVALAPVGIPANSIGIVTQIRTSARLPDGIIEDPDGQTNLRNVPKDQAGSKILTTIKNGEGVAVLEERADGSLLVRRKSTGATGFVFHKYVRATDETAHAELALFVRDHHAKASRKDVAGLLRDYNMEVDFLDEGVLSIKELAAKEEDYFNGTISLQETVVTKPSIKQIRYGLYSVKYRMEASRRPRTGKAESKLLDLSLEVYMASKAPKIISQKATSVR